ncbi:hypothetical protein TRFO_08513 [Tritrichomonas foetus]|uniref:Uncharacterized protein n=1 Tax=Tritrichomonas foetus TaxID=1144522 RepID=A0A1J4JPR9_9EUKA|nr:hypothetical protein TRFO_08513 [Tritrichomonas foetus]|eukprot:OHS99260.1 hypothetical protein TRFO_08513 [Tritrichomonas foetus]
MINLSNKQNEELTASLSHRMELTNLMSVQIDGQISSDEFYHLINELPKYLESLKTCSRDSFLESLLYFKQLIKFPEYPDSVKDQNFVLTLLDKLIQFSDDQTIYVFGTFIDIYYDHEIFSPPNLLIEFVENLFSQIAIPIQPNIVNIMLPYIKFLGSTTKYLHVTNLPTFYQHISNFIGVSFEYNEAVAYLYTKLMESADFTDELLEIFPSILQMFYQQLINWQNNPINMESLIRNVTCLLTYFIEECEQSKKESLFENVSDDLIPPLTSFWNVSADIDINLFIICVSPILPNISLKYLLDNNGFDVMINSIIEINDSSSYALELFANLMARHDEHIFIILNDHEKYNSFIERVTYLCVDGTINIRKAAGMLYSEFVIFNPRIVFAAFLNELNLTEINEFSPVSIFSNMLTDFDNDLHVANSAIKALFSISKLFYNEDKMHEFREICSIHTIEEKVNTILDNLPDDSDDDDDVDLIYNLGNGFLNTSFGCLSFEDYDEMNALQ